MNIAIAAEGNSMNSMVSQEFENCSYLLIVKMEDMSVKALENSRLEEDLQGEHLADEVLKHRCEAVITGKIKPEPFNILADAYITRFFGAGISVNEALVKMEKNELKIIKNHDDTKGCSGHHH